jgi:hypothetical protein
MTKFSLSVCIGEMLMGASFCKSRNRRLWIQLSAQGPDGLCICPRCSMPGMKGPGDEGCLVSRADMTTEERFERIENELAVIVQAQHGIVESQRIQAETLSQLMQTIGAYVESSNAHMKRVEDNLDGLIRAITAEHTNGKSKL